MKITALEVQDYQKVREVKIHPGDRALLIVGGNNCQGKSSLLSALEVAFGGARHAGPEPVRHGAKGATILVELDDGKLRIEKKISKAGKHTLEIREDGKRKKAPQRILDALVGERFLDPLSFLHAAAKAQRETLIQVAKVDIDLDVMATERADKYDERRDVNRDLARAKAQREGLGEEEKESPSADIDAARKGVEAIEAKIKTRAGADAQMEFINKEGKRIASEIGDLHQSIHRLENQREQLKRDWQAQQTISAAAGDPARIGEQHELAKEKVNEAITEAKRSVGARERNESRKALSVEVAALDKTHTELDFAIEEIDERKAAALAAAEMPIDGLDIADEHVVYNGAPLQQASDAERLQVSLAIAAALSPHLRDIWVRDGSLLDDQSLAAMRRFAEERDIRIWIERVGTDDDDAIIIEDGTVAG